MYRSVIFSVFTEFYSHNLILEYFHRLQKKPVPINHHHHHPPVEGN